ncbi:hypothetical protein LX90_009304 [Lentzea flava]|nr:hypothetical protein [Lentzea flava]
MTKALADALYPANDLKIRGKDGIDARCLTTCTATVSFSTCASSLANGRMAAFYKQLSMDLALG